MLETLFGSVLTAGITAASFTVCLIAALALGALVAAVYMYKNTCTQSMAVTLALLPAMVQIIILLVNGNLGAGVAVSGAFGLVRFRSAPGSARDITCIFLAMTLGLATGMGYIGIAVMTGVVMCLLLLVYAVPRRHPLPQRQSGHRLRQGSAGEGSALSLSEKLCFSRQAVF